MTGCGKVKIALVNYLIFLILFPWMKIKLFAFLLLLVVMPSLACAMPTCHKEEKQVVSKPCHSQNKAEHDTHSTQDDNRQMGHVDFLLDCMNVDLQTASDVTFDKPNLQIESVAYPSLDMIPSDLASLSENNAIRGPPFHVTSRPVYPQVSVVLSTQRFRI
ncbi:MAG: hypothetical protein CMH28_04905 [Micavibrio sp.]|nr:hypothetical protein [Micavibrio sp.]